MSGLRWTPEQYEEHCRKAAARVAEPVRPVATVPVVQRPENRFKSRAEARYADVLEAARRCGEIVSWRYEALTLKLADGVRFTPDFLVVESDQRMSLREVKGFMREAARVRLFIAVEQYPLFRWRLVWARRAGEFETEVLGEREG